MNKHFYGKYLLLKINGELQEIDNTNGELFDCTDEKCLAAMVKFLESEVK